MTVRIILSVPATGTITFRIKWAATEAARTPGILFLRLRKEKNTGRRYAYAVCCSRYLAA